MNVSLLACMLGCFSHVRLSVILWTVARQAPLTMGFSRHEYWSGLPCRPHGDLPSQRSDLCLLSLLHCRQVLYQWCHLGSPTMCVKKDFTIYYL